MECLRAWAVEWVAAWAAWITKPNPSTGLAITLTTAGFRKGPGCFVFELITPTRVCDRLVVFNFLLNQERGLQSHP